MSVILLELLDHLCRQLIFMLRVLEEQRLVKQVMGVRATKGKSFGQRELPRLVKHWDYVGGRVRRVYDESASSLGMATVAQSLSVVVEGQE